MKCVCVMSLVVVLVMSSLGFAAAVSISPAMDNVYGNSMTIGSETGQNGTIWNSTFSAAQVTGGLYAVDTQTANLVKWDQDNSQYRPLTLSSTSTWANGSLTYKFVAPTGKTFTGGNIIFQTASIWNSGSPTTIQLITHSGYGNNGYGAVAPSGVINQQALAMDQDWNWFTGTISVPAGVSEFYYTILANQDWRSVYGGVLSYADVTVVPEPATLLLLGLGGLAIGKRR